MKPAELLTRLGVLGIAVRHDGERLFLAPFREVPPLLLKEVRGGKPALVKLLKRIEGLRDRYDRLLARFQEFPDTPEAVASEEWLETVAGLNRTLTELDAAGSPATDAEVVCRFSGPGHRSARESR